MLKPYYDMNIWSKTDNGNPPKITSICSYNNDTNLSQVVICATKMLEDIKNILTYFQYQSDNTNVIVSGDGPDTGTGAVPLK